MRKCFILVMLTVLPFQILSAFNWPVPEPVITSTFGSNKWGSFNSGIEIYGNGLSVRPSEDGELIFYENAERPGVLPGGMGNFVVIEHDRKLRTLYAGMDLSDEMDGLTSVTSADLIGKTGGRGKSAVPHLHFAVIDSEFEQYVNPLLVLNSIVDNKAPVIEEIYIVNEDGRLPVRKKAVVGAGKAAIMAKIYDPCMSNDFNVQMAPYKIQLFLNGEEIFYLNFESLSYGTEGAVIQSRDPVSYSDLYKDNGYMLLGELSLVPGESRFEVLVSDYSENESGLIFKLTVVE